MSVREQHITRDIQECIYALLSQYASDTSPWSRWTVWNDYPDLETIGEFTAAKVYILPPERVDIIRHHGGKSRMAWEEIVGFWCDRGTGGPDEVQVFVSEVFYRFGDPQEINGKQFDVTLGTTAYSDVTLGDMNIGIRDVNGPSSEMGEGADEFRREMTLSLIA